MFLLRPIWYRIVTQIALNINTHIIRTPTRNHCAKHAGFALRMLADKNRIIRITPAVPLSAIGSWTDYLKKSDLRALVLAANLYLRCTDANDVGIFACTQHSVHICMFASTCIHTTPAQTTPHHMNTLERLTFPEINGAASRHHRRVDRWVKRKHCVSSHTHTAYRVPLMMCGKLAAAQPLHPSQLVCVSSTNTITSQTQCLSALRKHTKSQTQYINHVDRTHTHARTYSTSTCG